MQGYARQGRVTLVPSASVSLAKRRMTGLGLAGGCFWIRPDGARLVRWMRSKKFGVIVLVGFGMDRDEMRREEPHRDRSLAS